MIGQHQRARWLEIGERDIEVSPLASEAHASAEHRAVGKNHHESQPHEGIRARSALDNHVMVVGEVSLKGSGPISDVQLKSKW